MTALLLTLFSSLPYYRAKPLEPPRALNWPVVWVYFTDKGFKTDLEYQRVAEHFSPQLSPKAIERRIRDLKAAYNFDDLPVYEPYIDAIEGLGGRLRHRSSWLNAASFELDPEIIPEISSLPFAYKVEPVASYKRQATREELRPLKLLRQQEDTTEFKGFYGGSYRQVAMLNVPPAYFSGYTGSGVLVGLLDTGFKRRRWLGEDSVHRALANIRLVAEHDFLAGDNFWLRDDRSLDSIPGPQNLSLVQDPTIITDRSGGIHLFYVADTIEFRSQRWMFWSYSKDQGESWETDALSQAYSHAGPVAACQGDTIFLAYTKFAATERFGEIWFRLWDRTGGWSSATRIGTGKNPDLSCHEDGLYLVYTPDPYSLAFRYGALTPAGVEWSGETEVASGEPRILSPRVLAISSGEIKVFWVEQPLGRILSASSTDTGKTFSEPKAFIDSGAYRVLAAVVGDTVHLVWQDYTQAPLARLSYIRLGWGDTLDLTGPLPTIGGFSLSAGPDTIGVAYETQGMVYRLSSSDGGRSFGEPQVIDSSGFAYLPCLSPDGRYLAWAHRGDEDTDYEPDEDYIEQPNHGTRMLSIIGGCQPGQLVGVAPGARFLVAKTERHVDRFAGRYEYLVEEDAWVEGLEWLERSGADIVSSSLGYSDWYSYEDMDGRTSPASVAASRASERGLVVVTAAGNRDEDQPIVSYLVAPGDAEGVVTVGGVELDTLWQPGEPFPTSSWWDRSGFGPTPDGRMKPELVALATQVVAANPDSLNYYDWSGGTSCATALVAGCFALLKETHPDWDAETLKEVLFETASNFGSPNDTLGYGLPNLDSAVRYTPPIDFFYANSLDDPFPNPFIPSRDLRVHLPFQLLKPSRVRLYIYTINGELVRRPETPLGILMPGRYYGTRPDDPDPAAWWDGKNEDGLEVASGIYLIVLQTGYGGDVKKVVLVR